jgi:peptidoglycan/LPS O-acetylase OafA/YrhL
VVPVAWLRWMGEKGWLGVDLFFVLSGFLIGGILLDHRPAANYYRVFYLRRFLRIVPIYAVLVLPGVLVLAFGLQQYFGGHSIAGQSVGGALLCVFFVQNFAALLPWPLPGYLVPTWSVAVEEQFYLLLPPLVRNVDRKQLLKILIVAIAAAPLLRGVLYCLAGDKAGHAAYTALPCRWDGLLLGVLCAMAYREPAFRSWIAVRLRGARIFWLLAALVSIAWVSLTKDRLDPHLQILGYTMVDAFFAVTLLLAVLNPAGTLHRALGWRGFKPVATISYTLYLLHTPMLGFVESLARYAHVTCDKISWTEFAMGMISLAATVVVSALSWRYFESRMIRLGHGYGYEMPPTGEAGGPKEAGLAGENFPERIRALNS